ncbi:MAG: hypothetical protein AB8H12_10035 [Lewinella sp.]
MKQSITFFFLFVLTLTTISFSSCGGDDDVNPIAFIGRDFGWAIESVNSNFQESADAAIAALSDEDIAAAGRTRAGITASFDTLIATQTNVEACDLDDALFFIENGAVQILKGDVMCPETGDPSVFAPFNNTNYSTNFDASVMTFRRSDGSTQGVYDVVVLVEGMMQLDQRRVISDTLVGNVEYDISYRLTGN